MSYGYEAHRAWLATDEGLAAVGQVLRNIERVLVPAGAASMNKLWPSTGDSWQMMAAVDHCCVLGVIREVEQKDYPAGQDRIFVKVPA